jgi:hypothetical protein
LPASARERLLAELEQSVFQAVADDSVNMR